MQLKDKLKYFGINFFLLSKSLILFGISKKLYRKNKFLKLSDKLLNNLDFFLKNTFIIDIKLRDKIFMDIKKLKILHSYKGFRHTHCLHFNGQRTKTNNKTNKKKRKYK